MFFKSRTEFFNKNLFSLLIAASLAIHAILIFMSPQANQIFSLSSLRESFIREPSEYAVTLELENTDTQIESTSDLDSKYDKSELKKEEDAEKKKYKIFTDTSDNADDEETNVDTDKIGEKGAVAKDNFPNDELPVNNEPHAEGHSKAPLLGKGGALAPDNGQQQPQPQAQEITAQAFVTQDSPNDKDSPPRYANLPKGLENQEAPVKHLQTTQPQSLSEKRGETTTEMKTIKLDKTMPSEVAAQAPKRERLTIGGSNSQEDADPLSYNEGILFADKKDEVNKESETAEKALSALKKHEDREKAEAEANAKALDETKETKNTGIPEPEIPAPPSELTGVEPQRRFDRGLDGQENPDEAKKPKVFFNVNAKKEGANKDPVLFEDTISNAAIPGAPSFNVKKHEYADYFKHIRDRISLYWFLGYGTRAEIKLETRDDKPVVVEFKVLPDGSISEVKIVDDAGNFNLASRLVSSIQNAAPLNPFPSKIKEPSIDVRFNFYFF
ncbi:MAG: TonB C-terminal domain-containing protein [Candidatus Brocadia sp.]|nr:TonB C-terminal domain-containing protein [Candidatus Brocadia sp.]